MIRPADLCHQWCHKFVVFISLVKLLHAVESAAFEALDAGIGLCNIRPHIPIPLDQFGKLCLEKLGTLPQDFQPITPLFHRINSQG